MDIENAENKVITACQDVNEFAQQASRATVQAIRCSHSLPTAGDDFDYYSSFESFRRLMDIESTRILELIQQIMRYHGVKGNLSSTSQALALEDKFDVLVDANDQLLERAGTYLDEASGIKKETPLVIASVTPKSSQPAASWNRKPSQNVASVGGKSKGASFRLLSAKHIQRPQLKFKEKIDNSHKPFIPKLKEKPHALKPLQESLLIPSADDENSEEVFSYPHPYQYELDHFTPFANQLEKVEPQRARPLDETPLTMVNTEESLVHLCEVLQGEKEIAVDVEHHSYRSFLGIVCLLQISTRNGDYLIDTLLLRHKLHILNQVFADPAIIKVFHGADSDIEWLQRDFGLYVVNMFDTGQAARVLGMARYSLSYLLLHYCKVEANKQFQLADWRIRPLPEELIHYAREDTHYLLYIHDMMKNQLLERGNQHKNLLHSVLQRSKQICLKTFEKPRLVEEAHMELYRKSKKLFNSQQMAAFKGIFEWRDKMARKEDESTGYVLPNHMLQQISDILPREPQGILACCNPIPPLVRQSLNELHLIVKQARELPLHKLEPTRKKMKPTKLEHPKYSVDSTLNCLHDLTHQEKRRDISMDYNLDQSIIAEKSKLFADKALVQPIVLKESPIISFFSTITKPEKEVLTTAQKKALKLKMSFKSPFEKYMPLPKAEAMPIVTQEKMEIGEVEATDKWKLLPKTMSKAAATPPPPKPSVHDTTVNTGNKDAIKFDEDNLQPIRYQLPSKRQSKTDVPIQASTKPDASPSEEKRRKITESNAKKESPETKEFKAHDYKSTDYSQMFQESTSGHSKQSTGKHKQHRDFNPDRQQMEARHKEVRKPNLSSGSSKKSMTYTQKKGQSAKIHWPKR